MIVEWALLFLLATTDHALGGTSDYHESSGISKTRCIERERLALLSFKQGLVDDLDSLSSWKNSSKDCCAWTGIRCDNLTNHIIMLDLCPIFTYYDGSNSVSWYPMRGEIGSSLVQLLHLEHLDLSYNEFSKIPKFIGALKRLKYLNLSSNSIVGNIPLELGNLTKLRILDLRYNKFSKIPKFIGALKRLKYLDLSDNSIVGNIPLEIGNLTKLRILGLGSLSSPMTAYNFEWISHLFYLRTFKLSGTNFTKAVDWFQSFKTAPSLSTLELSNCQFPQLEYASSLSQTNSSNSLRTLSVFASTFESDTVSRLLNLSNNLVDLTLSENFNIKGPIPNSFENLKSLRHFILSYNFFEGEIPKSMGNLCNLQEFVLYGNRFNSTLNDIMESLSGCHNNSLEILDLHFNSLIGPLPDISNLSSLRELDVSYNNLNGTLPESIGKLFNLEVLHVSYNKLLNGPLPESIGKLFNLEVLDLSYNKLLNGTLPESIGKLFNLEVLDLSSNSFTGVISEAHLEKLSKLHNLDLSSNSLTLKLAFNWVPPFQLQKIYLRSCMLGPQFPSWLRTQSNISYLDLSSSGISDAIPNWFFSITSKLHYLDLSFNAINSTLPNIPLDSRNFPFVDLSSNQFHGSIPPNSLFNATLLNLSNNTLTTFGPLFCTILDGVIEVLDISNNLLFGSLPDCWFRFSNLEILNLDHNKLSGLIPNSMASLYQIRTLQLRHNNFSGKLSTSLKSCTKLEVLDVGENNLDGKIPTWIGETLTNLVVLQLKSNKFQGNIPSSLCLLQSIQIFDISQNNISGVIPSCINNFNSMVEKLDEGEGEAHFVSGRGYYVDKELVRWKGLEYEYRNRYILGQLRVIDLSSNRLIGEIPKELTNLVEVIQLNLSRNNLSGAIPEKIGNLSKLESLDLSHNNLSGNISLGLAKINFLAYLDLSYNHLSGRIPTGTQLQSFNASSYVGNSELCGPPLSTLCPGEDPNPDSGDEGSPVEDGQKWFDMSWFYMGMGVGFAFGFLGVCGALFCRFLNNFGDWLYMTITIRTSRLKRCIRK